MNVTLLLNYAQNQSIFNVVGVDLFQCYANQL
jgi:hypothetical protein